MGLSATSLLSSPSFHNAVIKLGGVLGADPPASAPDQIQAVTDFTFSVFGQLNGPPGAGAFTSLGNLPFDIQAAEAPGQSGSQQVLSYLKVIGDISSVASVAFPVIAPEAQGLRLSSSILTAVINDKPSVAAALDNLAIFKSNITDNGIIYNIGNNNIYIPNDGSVGGTTILLPNTDANGAPTGTYSLLTGVTVNALGGLQGSLTTLTPDPSTVPTLQDGGNVRVQQDGSVFSLSTSGPQNGVVQLNENGQNVYGTVDKNGNFVTTLVTSLGNGAYLDSSSKNLYLTPADADNVSTSVTTIVSFNSNGNLTGSGGQEITTLPTVGPGGVLLQQIAIGNGGSVTVAVQPATENASAQILGTVQAVGGVGAMAVTTTNGVNLWTPTGTGGALTRLMHDTSRQSGFSAIF